MKKYQQEEMPSTDTFIIECLVDLKNRTLNYLASPCNQVKLKCFKCGTVKSLFKSLETGKLQCKACI